MNHSFFEASYKQAITQRNLFIFLSFFLSISLIALSSLLFFKRERIIISPPHIQKEFWVDGNSVSPTYIEQFSSFMGQLLLNKSVNSAPNQRTILLRHTYVSFAPELRQKLIREEEMLKKQNSSYVFYPVSISVDCESLTSLISGDRVCFVNEKQISTVRESYLLSFVYTGSGFFLDGITDKTSRSQ